MENHKILQSLIDEIDSLEGENMNSVNFKVWHKKTIRNLKRIFGTNSEQVRDFKDVYYGKREIGFEPCHHDFYSGGRTLYNTPEEGCKEGLEYAKPLLTTFLNEIPEENIIIKDSNTILSNLFLTFNKVTRAIKSRYDNRSTLDINDEYDVQDLLYGLLQISFDNVVYEDPSPKQSGGSSRIDFVLPDEKIGIEVKMTRKGLNDKKVGEQLLIDIGRYEKHPDCNELYCFVYDPEGYIKNPKKLKDDLETGAKYPVFIFIEPKL